MGIPLKILHVASEFAPLIKVGGLADVVYGLTKEQARLGHQVELLLPWHESLNNQKLPAIDTRTLQHDGDEITIGTFTYEGITIYLLKGPDHKQLFEGKIYGQSLESIAYLSFTKACCTMLTHEPRQEAFTLHLHDWMSAGMPLLFSQYPAVEVSCHKVVITLHNLAHQGVVTKDQLEAFNFPYKAWLNQERFRHDKHPESLNLIQSAIHLVDHVVVVSDSYKEEIAQKGKSHGLFGTIQENQSKFHGILNGIDTKYWSLFDNDCLPQADGAEAIKQAAKLELTKRTGIKIDQPLGCCITRLTEQKGPKLIEAAIKEALSEDASFILVGQPTDDYHEKWFTKLAKQLKSDQRAHFSFTYDEKLSHLVFAASDWIVVPSKFEPCGLTQMIAMRYGCVPVVRSTGGLKDTVFDPKSNRGHMPNGFTFEPLSTPECQETVRRAIFTYRSDQKLWKKLQKKGLTTDFSWSVACQKYLKLYSC